jgi:hypothetical protein
MDLVFRPPLLKVQAMRRGEKSPERVALQKCWGRWTKVVELFARRRRARKRVDAKDYVTLHHELIQKCRLMAESANDMEAPFYRSLEELVRPWLNLAILERAERDILFDLVTRCRQVHERLRGRTRIGTFPIWIALLPVILMFFSIMLLWMRDIPLLYGLSLDHIRGWSDVLWFNVIHASNEQRLLFVGCALVGISIFFVTRNARS